MAGEGAHRLWASAWSRDEAIRHYGLSSENHVVASIGAIWRPPPRTLTRPKFHSSLSPKTLRSRAARSLVRAPGVRRRHPEATLTVLGQQPPAEYARMPGVRYAGYLRKTEPDQLAQFRSILASSFCLVHPTQSDTIAQGIIEAAYFGCPSIAPRRFAIPELILDRQRESWWTPHSRRATLSGRCCGCWSSPRAMPNYAAPPLPRGSKPQFRNSGETHRAAHEQAGEPEAKSSQGMTVDSR